MSYIYDQRDCYDCGRTVTMRNGFTCTDGNTRCQPCQWKRVKRTRKGR